MSPNNKNNNDNLIDTNTVNNDLNSISDSDYCDNICNGPDSNSSDTDNKNDIGSVDSVGTSNYNPPTNVDGDDGDDNNNTSNNKGNRLTINNETTSVPTQLCNALDGSY